MAADWAIKDDKQILVQGPYDEIMHRWNVNTLGDEFYPKYYGDTPRDKSLIIKNYFGGLQLIHIICDMPATQKEHVNMFYKD